MKDTSYLVSYSLLGLLVGALLYSYSLDGADKVPELIVKTSEEVPNNDNDSKLAFETPEAMLARTELEGNPGQEQVETDDVETEETAATPVEPEVETESITETEVTEAGLY